jgi:2-amino-4-hydroxy-6-hydroxymethyldihydropteridine diphosphokinase
MARAFISMGSNIDPQANIRAALRALARQLSVASISKVYPAPAEGRSGQPLFYNCIVEVETDIAPVDLKYKILRPIEAALGRERDSDKYAPRTIDLDLVLYGNITLNTNGLVLPDPGIWQRSFLAIPLAELARNWIIPGIGKSAADIATVFRNNDLHPLISYTSSLAEEILLNA